MTNLYTRHTLGEA